MRKPADFSQDTSQDAHPGSPQRKAKLKLIDATLQSLMEEGMEGCSVRKIAQRAGVSVGLINYHFESVHHLVAEAYAHLALKFLNNAVAAGDKYQGQPRKQISVFLEEIFAEQVMQREVLQAWVVFWGLIDSAPPIREAHEHSNESSINYLESLFQQLAGETSLVLSPRLSALGLNALIDGLWLEWCLQSDGFEPMHCTELCEHWVNTLGKASG